MVHGRRNREGGGQYFVNRKNKSQIITTNKYLFSNKVKKGSRECKSFSGILKVNVLQDPNINEIACKDPFR